MIVLFFVCLLAVHCQVSFGFLRQCGTVNVGCLCRKAGTTKPVCRLNEYRTPTELVYESSTRSYRVRSQSFNHHYCFYSNSTGKYQASQSGTCPDQGFQWSVVGFCLETGGSEPCCRNSKCSSCNNYERSCEFALGPTVPTPTSRSTPTPKMPTSPTPSPTPQPTPMPIVSTTTTITSTLITATRSTVDETVKPTTTTTVAPISETMKSTPQTSTDPFQIAATLSKSRTMTSITTENNDNSALVYALIAVGCVLLLAALAIFLFVLNKKRSKVRNKENNHFSKS